MSTSEQSLAGQVADQIAEQIAPPIVKPDEVSREREQHLHILESALRQRARGIAQFYDEGVRDLDKLANRAVDLGEIERRQLPPAQRAAVAEETRKRALEEVKSAGKVARGRLEVARARVADELLPPVPRSADRDRAEHELADELALRPETGPALTGMFRQYLNAGDTYAARVIAGDWGRRRYMSSGGTAEGWSQLRRSMLAEAAAGSQGVDRRRFDFLLTSDPDKLLTILELAAIRSAEAIR